MPSPKSELPEGTDHIINGAMETGGSGGEDRDETIDGGETGAGFIGSGAGDDTGGTSGGGTAMAKKSSGGDGSAVGNGVVDQLKSRASDLRGQAGGRVREFAEGGKNRATDALDELSKVVADTAESIDQRLGGDYGEYARRASDAVAGFADTLRQKDVDEVYDNVRDAVRKSPGVAVGIAAVVGFTLVRLVKAGLEDGRESGGRSNRDA
ncbi:MAG TPA: hypothetical protein VIT45_13170 [Allosphingosinicella sp.]